LAASALAGVGSAALTATAADAPAGQTQEYYEWRLYRLQSAANLPLLHSYLETAAIPAKNRIGIKLIGVFTEKEPKESPLLFVLTPYPTLDAFMTTSARMKADAAYQQAGAEYLQVPRSSPAFERIDTWLLRAFSGMPAMEIPAYSRDRKPRLFEVRTYEAYSTAKSSKKIDMFNQGEIAIMRRVGLAPVFFGQAIVGSNLPHLTYMTSAENEEAHKQHWDAFRADAEWVKMRTDPQYADTVSKNTPWILVPTPYSQI
jgi:hypothetical protein